MPPYEKIQPFEIVSKAHSLCQKTSSFSIAIADRQLHGRRQVFFFFSFLGANFHYMITEFSLFILYIEMPKI